MNRRSLYNLPLFELAAVLLSWWAFARASHLPRLTLSSAKGRLPALSIIVPARNEAQNLRRLLPSLRSLRYPGPLEILVVDDESGDETAEVAAAFEVTVLRAGPRPPGWLGKPFAAHRGAEAASGEWLLFTDADTWHAPDSAARAVAWALQHQVDAITLFPDLETERVWEAAALAVAFAGLFAGLRRFDGLINGQYLLIPRAVYFASGGFAAVRDQMLEDLALGQRLRALGYRIALVDGRDIVRVRTDGDLAEWIHRIGRWASGVIEAQAVRPWVPVLLTMGTALPLIDVRRDVGRERLWARLLRWALAGLGTYPWTRRWGWPAAAGLAPLGAALLSVSALWGLARRWSGRGIPWKGRRVR